MMLAEIVAESWLVWLQAARPCMHSPQSLFLEILSMLQFERNFVYLLLFINFLLAVYDKYKTHKDVV
jgi:hypothetical protein